MATANATLDTIAPFPTSAMTADDLGRAATLALSSPFPTSAMTADLDRDIDATLANTTPFPVVAATADLIVSNRAEMATVVPLAVNYTRTAVYPVADPALVVRRKTLGAYGGLSVCAGPDDMLVIAGSEGRSLAYVHYRDEQRLVTTERRLDARPVAVASNDEYLYVACDDATLRVFSNADSTGPEVSRLALGTGNAPQTLWASADASFIVIVSQTGVLQVRSKEPALTLLAEHQTQLYRLRTLQAVRRSSIEQSGEVLWDIVAFSQTTARGVVVRYREYTYSTTFNIIGTASASVHSLVPLVQSSAEAEVIRKTCDKRVSGSREITQTPNIFSTLFGVSS